MTRKCPACGYERKPLEVAPEWQCPSCKIAYKKYQEDGRYLDPVLEQQRLEKIQAKEQELADDDATYDALTKLSTRMQLWMAAGWLAGLGLESYVVKHIGNMGNVIGGITMIFIGLVMLNYVKQAKSYGAFEDVDSYGLTKKSESPVSYYTTMLVLYFGAMFFVLWGGYFIFRLLTAV